MLAANTHLTQSQLGLALECDFGYVSNLITRLLAKGFVTKSTLARDKICTVISPTETGKAMIRKIRGIVSGVDHMILSNPTDEENKFLVTLL